MTNTGIIFRVAVFNIVVSQVALSLGITTSTLTRSTGLTIGTDLSLAESVVFAIEMVINNFGSLVQLLTFQVTIPPIWNIMIFVPISLTLVYLFISLFRGSS